MDGWERMHCWDVRDGVSVVLVVGEREVVVEMMVVGYGYYYQRWMNACLSFQDRA